MGKADTRQPRLTFDGQKKLSRLTPDDRNAEAGPSPRESPSVLSSELKQMMQEMRQGFTTIAEKMDDMSMRMDAFVHKLEGHEERLNEAEQRISNTEDRTTQLQSQVAHMDKLLKVIASKNEDLEARSRRNNICVIGIPESTNTGKMEDFVEKLLTATIGADALSSQFIVERAHRSLAPRPPPGAAPRPIIARLLNYRDRDAALRIAREKRQLQFEGLQFTLYPDFTAIVQEERRKFLPAKQKLRLAQIDYALLYPAKLRVTHQGQQMFFTKPQQVDEFLKCIKKASPSQNSSKEFRDSYLDEQD